MTFIVVNNGLFLEHTIDIFKGFKELSLLPMQTKDTFNYSSFFFDMLAKQEIICYFLPISESKCKKNKQLNQHIPETQRNP